MLSKTANVTFVPDSSVFTDQASAASVLNDFVDIAKTLDGTMIVINGNINADNQTDVGKQLSANRAQTVANYMASQYVRWHDRGWQIKRFLLKSLKHAFHMLLALLYRGPTKEATFSQHAF